MSDDDDYVIHIEDIRIFRDDDFLNAVTPGNVLSWPEDSIKTYSESSKIWREMFGCL